MKGEKIVEITLFVAFFELAIVLAIVNVLLDYVFMFVGLLALIYLSRSLPTQ